MCHQWLFMTHYSHMNKLLPLKSSLVFSKMELQSFPIPMLFHINMIDLKHEFRIEQCEIVWKREREKNPIFLNWGLKMYVTYRYERQSFVLKRRIQKECAFDFLIRLTCVWHAECDWWISIKCTIETLHTQSIDWVESFSLNGGQFTL